jgi:hypothetical protein
MQRRLSDLRFFHPWVLRNGQSIVIETEIYFKLKMGFATDNTQIHISQTPWPLVRERTIPTERPPLVDEI